ncbi:histidine kinase [Hoyosella sp. YIM 151337]|uniref:sensor histidine kinase n=1 Tax=Hoyosella sp. YIM 151337 TaxID=2992742 RepID=UPI002235CA82|nr:histidine kinase [Hoyosella sp. YIM 151337]MCW4353693.1 histidine kinase [Hoyosella sp. YIM 151337]
MSCMRGRTVTSTIHVFLGAALALPFIALGWAFASSMRMADSTNAVLLILLAVVTAGLAVAVLTAPPVRQLEVAAARLLLGAEVPDVRHPRSWDSRLRGLGWFVLNTVAGSMAALVLITGVPMAAGLFAFPFLDGARLRYGTAQDAVIEAGGGWSAAWAVPVGVFVGAATIAFLVGTGAVLRRAAPAFLGPTPADRLALAQSRELELAARNELARELHDSVGHALTAMLMQATAAGRIADTRGGADAAVRDSLAAIEYTGRAALGELDRMLGLLRDAPADAGQTRTLADVHSLAGNAPVPVEVTEEGDARSLPPRVSAEAYRIVQEGVTNAARYGAGTVRVRLVATPEELTVTVRNTIRARDPVARDGHGLNGIRERLLLLGGELDAGEHSGEWVLRALLPVARRPA